MATKKSFFQDRTVSEIMELNPDKVYSDRTLVKDIMSLKPDEAIIITDCIYLIPGTFIHGTENRVRASRKYAKHGELIQLIQPRTQQEALASSAQPVDLRRASSAKAFIDDEGKPLKQKDIFYAGYSWRAVQGPDRRQRIVPFSELPKAERLYTYAMQLPNGIEFKPYSEAKKVSSEGATVFCTVPSRTPKHPRYPITLKSVPAEANSAELAIALSFKTEYAHGMEPQARRYWNLRFNQASSAEYSDVIIFDCHDIAAYIALAFSSYKTNPVPMDMIPFALLSKLEAEFCNKLWNNVLVEDNTLEGKLKLRHPHDVETSVLMARTIPLYGHDNTFYAKGTRDGMIKDYQWGPRS